MSGVLPKCLVGGGDNKAINRNTVQKRPLFASGGVFEFFSYIYMYTYL